MARATGTIAPGPEGACGLSLKELFGSKCVSTSEVGGLLKRAVSLKPVFRRPPFFVKYWFSLKYAEGVG
jgi:hypothetical protein